MSFSNDKFLILGHDAVSMFPNLSQFMKDKKQKELEQKQSQLEAEHIAEGDFFCTKCGTKQSKSDSRFCSKCGNQLQSPIESDQ